MFSQIASGYRPACIALMLAAASPAFAQHDHHAVDAAAVPQVQAKTATDGDGPYPAPAVAPTNEAMAALYKNMAPLPAYLGKGDADEVAIARSAVPASIADDAEVLVFDAKGYHQAVAGKNGWTCLVQRSWLDDFSNPEFWNPRIRVPICFNPQASRSVLPVYLERTKWVLEKRSLPEIMATAKTHPIPDPATGSFAIMMSRHGYVGDATGTPGPHVMIFLPDVPPSAWGFGLKGAPIFAAPGDKPSTTIFFLGVRRWSDGTLP